MDQNKGAAHDATCSFSMYPVCDGYAQIVLNALHNAPVRGVSRRTDGLETCVYGATARVFAAVRSVFAGGVAANVPIIFRGTFSPEEPLPSRLIDDLLPAPPANTLERQSAEDALAPANNAVTGKLAIYPARIPEVGADYITQGTQILEATALHIRRMHDAIRFEGPLHTVWSSAEQYFSAAAGQTVIELCILANSRFVANTLPEGENA